MTRPLAVLLVEDSPSDAALVGEACASTVVLEVAPTLREAEARLARGGIDVVLLDLGLPDSQGLDTLTALRSRYQDATIVVLTGFRDSGELGLAAVRLGAQDYLSKDQLTLPLLSRTLNYAVERKRLQDALLASERHYSQRLEQQVAERTALAEQRATQLRELATALALSEQRERQRISRLLHDELQQLLVAATYLAGQLASASSEKQRAQNAQRLQRILQDAIEQSRSLTAQLSPPVLFDAGLAQALQWLQRQLQENHGLSVRLEVLSAIPTMPIELTATIFESVRELLFNVIKHSHASEAAVSVELRPGDQLRVVVTDQGAGFDRSRVGHAGEHFGLANLNHRVGLIGGRFVLHSEPGKGCMAEIIVPAVITAGDRALGTRHDQTTPSKSKSCEDR
jgi:signal transduction histidine kinase